MAQTQPKGKDHPDAKALQTRREAQVKSNEEAMKRMDGTSAQPTPTQEENDLAAMGIHVEKQDSGAGPTIITSVTVANVPYDENAPPTTPEPKTKKA